MDIETTHAQYIPAAQDDTPHSVACLVAMPPEILAKIVAAVERPSDLWALRRTSTLFASVSPTDLAVRWGAQRMHRLLASGAPLNVATAAMTARGRPLSAMSIVDAVNGKRLDVVAFALNSLLVRRRYPPLFLSLVSSCSSVDRYVVFCACMTSCLCAPCAQMGPLPLLVLSCLFFSNARVLTLLFFGVCLFGRDRACAQMAGGCDQQDRDDGVPPPLITHAQERTIGDLTVEATALAALHGLTSIVRHLIRTSRVARKALRNNDRLAYNAVGAQSLDTLIYAHDMQVYDNTRCTCAARVGDTAWRSARPDMVEWMLATGCEGFVPLNATRAAHAIRKGHLDMLRFMRAHGLDAVCNGDRRTIAYAVHRAARKGALDTLAAVAEMNLCPTITPVLTGAAAHGNDGVMRWALDETGPCITRWGTPDRLAVRAAAASAATVDKVHSVEFLLARYADAIDLGLLMWYAITNDSINVVKWLETRLSVPFVWRDALSFAVCARSSRVLRYMVEHQRVPFDPLALVIGSSSQGDDVLDLVCGVCTHDQLQRAVDVMSAVSFKNYVSTVRGIHRRVPTICVAQVAASETYTLTASLDIYEDDSVALCECPRCVPLRPDCDAMTAPTPSTLSDAVAQEPPRKRARLDNGPEDADNGGRPLLANNLSPAPVNP